jgi:glycosyltransferase involved in cell wall biosynthesis
MPAELGPNSISAAVIVRNEDDVIGRCLESLDGVVDEIVLVHDGPCEDRTVEIAESHGCRVFVRPATGSPELQTVFAYEQCRGEWLLNVDADEYLDGPLRERLRELVARDDVNGYEFLWRMWDGERYITERGPFKLVLFRRHAAHLVGMNEAFEHVDGRIERSELELKHHPTYNNFELRRVFTKWRRRAKVQAKQFLTPFDQLPKFNWEGQQEWPRWRHVANALSPLLFVPYGLAHFALALARERDYYSPKENLRFAFYQGLYAGMCQFYVARFKYLGSPDP